MIAGRRINDRMGAHVAETVVKLMLQSFNLEQVQARLTPAQGSRFNCIQGDIRHRDDGRRTAPASQSSATRPPAGRCSASSRTR